MRALRRGLPGRRHLPRSRRERRHRDGRPALRQIYQIHKTRCIFCGYCEEACPVSAIFMGKDYELAVYSKQDFIWDKEDLLVPADRPAPRRRRSPAVTPYATCVTAVRSSTRSTRARARLRRRDGHDALRQGRLPQSLLRRAEPDAAGPRRRRPPGLRARRRRRHRDQHVRRQPASSSRASAWPTRCARSTSQGARIARAGRARRRVRRRLDRSARRAHRAVGQDRRRRGRSGVPRAGRRRWPRAASTCSCSRRSAT